MIHILLAEDQTLVRDGLCALLSMEFDFVVKAVANGQEAVVSANAALPDIAIIDVRMPVMDGIECTRLLRQSHPNLAIMILTTFDDQALVQAGLDAGANAYLLKDIDPQDLVNAIRLLVAGETLVPGDLARALVDETVGRLGSAPDRQPLAAEPLTPRQLEILGLIADGLSNREIAERLYLSEGTVKNAVSEIYARLQVRDRVQAVLKMMARGEGRE